MTKKARMKSGAKTRCLRKFKWMTKASWRRARAWKRSLFREQRELDAFRKCVRLERKAMDYPRSVPLLTELMNAYRATGQEGRRFDVMRRLRDIEPRPVPDFMWDEQPSVKVVRHNVKAWCAMMERFVREWHMESIHLQHIQNVLKISYDNASLVCDELESRSILGPYDMATGGHRVLIDTATHWRAQ